MTHDAPRARIRGASPHPPSQTMAIDPASFFGFVVDEHFSVLSPLGALAMSATDSPLRCVKPYGVELSRLRLRDPSFLPWGA